jgi:hypothetical protein
MNQEFDIELARSLMFEPGSPAPEITANARSRLLAAAGADRRPLIRHRLGAPRRLLLGIVSVLGLSAGAAAATGVFINANTHTYNHGWRHTAGGPGVILNLAGTNYVQVVLKQSEAIPYPAGYRAWRVYAINTSHLLPCGALARICRVQESTGFVDVGIAQSAFCAWILAWRHAELTGKQTQASNVARVIARVLSWRAITDVEYISGTYSQEFAWMHPLIQAVTAHNLRQVDRLIRESTDYFAQDDPRFAPEFLQRIRLARGNQAKTALWNREASNYMRFLQRAE